MNTKEDLSLRQMLAAVVLAGLSLGAAQAGETDWRFALLGGLAAVPLMTFLLVRLRRGPVYRGVYGVVLTAVYTGWSVVSLAHVLGQAARRLERTGGSGGVAGWVIVLLALMVIWMAWGKPAAFFRGGEVYWLALTGVLVVVALLTLPHVTVSYLWSDTGAGWTSAVAGAGAVATAGWVLPYIYKVSPQRSGEAAATGRWLILLCVLTVALAALTRGILGGAATQLEHPFFVAAGVMGESARTEGLLSALWLICDLVWAGLLTRVWGGGKGPVVCGVLGAALALTGWTDSWPGLVWPAGNLLVAVAAALTPRSSGKIVVKF